MNYIKIYNDLIDRGKNRIIHGYTENHHIVPRCMGGTNDETNLVRLTPEEHYVAHQLLSKIYPNNGALIKAVVMMLSNRPSNKLYGWIRRRHSVAMRESQTGSENSQFGTKWIHSVTLRQSKKIEKNEEVPLGWELGRVVCWDKKIEREKTDSCGVCGDQKPIHYKFCSNSCAATYNNSNRETIFDLHIEDMITDYKNGMSIYRCLVSRGFCGTGKNFTTLKKLLETVGGKSIGADTTL
jgi:hypothetical protein